MGLVWGEVKVMDKNRGHTRDYLDHSISKSYAWGRHTVSKGGVRLFGVPESGKDISSLLTSPKLDIKLNQNSKSSCTSQNWFKPMVFEIFL